MNVKINRFTKLEAKLDTAFSEGHYNEAISLANELLDQSEHAEDQKAMMKAYLNLAGSYYYLGQIDLAFENVLQYKLLCDEHGDDQDKFYLFNLSSLIYEFDENYVKAKDAMNECINIALELEMYQAASACLNKYSYYYILEKNYSEAAKNANASMILAKKHCPGDILLHCQIYFNLAKAYIGLDRLEEAKEILEPLRFNAYLKNSLHEKGHYYFTLSLLYTARGEYEKSLYTLKEAYCIFSDLNNKMMLKSITKNLSEIYEIVHDYENAYEILKQYTIICEQLFTVRLNSKIKEIDIKHSIAEIEKRANLDCLTGVYNRYYIEMNCNSWLKERKITRSSICCIVLDVDHFKNINDTYGHLIGDEVIKTVGNTCKQVMEEENTIVGRYGGDEFIVLLKDYPSNQIMAKAQQLFQALSDLKVQYGFNTIQITVSMGIVCSDGIPTVKKFTQLFKIADQALYMAKNQGKNQIVFLSKENCGMNN